MKHILCKVPPLWSWLGQTSSYQKLAEGVSYLRAHPEFAAQVLASSDFNESAGEDDDEEDEFTRLMDYLADAITFKADSVGVVEINGDLWSETSFWNSWLGAVSYDTLVYATQRFVEDGDVSSIALSWSTDGGSAEGIDAAADALKDFQQVKPINSYIKSRAMSAGYWLASVTGRIYGSRMSEVGSIGAMVEYMSRHRMLQEAGIDVEIVRSAPEKALGHPDEPLNDKAIRMFEERVKTFAGFFVQHVVSNRPVSLEKENEWGTGRGFLFNDAIALGLADEILSFDKVIARMNTENSAPTESPEDSVFASSHKPILLNGGPMAHELTIAKEKMDAIAAGATPEAAGLSADELAVLQAQASTQEEAGEPSAAAGEAAATDFSGEAAATDEQTDAQTVVLTGYLKDELRESQQKQAELVLQVTSLTEQLEVEQQQGKLMTPVVVALIKQRQLVLGQAAAQSLDSMEVPALLSLYSQVNTEFETRFTPGRQSLAKAEAEEVSTEDLAARLNLPVREES